MEQGLFSGHKNPPPHFFHYFFMPYKLCSCISFLILALVPMSCVCFLKLTLSPKRKPRKPTFSVLLSRICLNKHRSCIPCMKWRYHMTPLAAFLHCPSCVWDPPFSLATCVNCAASSSCRLSSGS